MAVWLLAKQNANQVTDLVLHGWTLWGAYSKRQDLADALFSAVQQLRQARGQISPTTWGVQGIEGISAEYGQRIRGKLLRAPEELFRGGVLVVPAGR
jgi:hypothetical protein